MLDTIKLDEIKKYIDSIPISGITSTPSIIKREGKIDFIPHMKKTRGIIGNERTLHMQVVARNFEGMVKDAKTIWNEIDKHVFVKIPATYNGIKAIRYLKSQGECNITASAIYSKMQAFLAIQAGADYIAVYSNRSENIGVDPFKIIKASRRFVDREGHETKIMASSIKNIFQITEAIESEADAVTFAPNILATVFDNASIKQAVDRFSKDWIELYEKENIF
ncbi:MAG: fructose-6-phosphate aldolase [Clostridium sp.]|nr:fructose-6-phosphate aldolase [Clostridium sp.]MCH3963490.1 fructose-6-phosphate aldolase [Clostridium sp.]